MIRLLKSSGYALIVLFELSALLLLFKAESLVGGLVPRTRSGRYCDGSNCEFPECEDWNHYQTQAPRVAP